MKDPQTIDQNLTAIISNDIVAQQLINGHTALEHIPPSVAFFGSARTKRRSKYYKAARKTARLAAEAGFSIITGGGPAIMEASNRGAQGGSAFHRMFY